MTYERMESVELERQDLRDIDFRGADLRDADFRDTDLRGADFDGARGGIMDAIAERDRVIVQLREHLADACDERTDKLETELADANEALDEARAACASWEERAAEFDEVHALNAELRDALAKALAGPSL